MRSEAAKLFRRFSKISGVPEKALKRNYLKLPRAEREKLKRRYETLIMAEEKTDAQDTPIRLAGH